MNMRLKTAALAAALAAGACVGAAFAQDLPDGQGKAEVLSTCTGCHGVDRMTNLRLSREDWRQKAQSMRELGAEGSDETFAKIVDYLAVHYGDGSAQPTAAPAVASPSDQPAQPASGK